MTSQRDFLQMYNFCAGVRGNAVATTIDAKTHHGFVDVGAHVHSGEPIRFYEDCIKDKAFVVNFMSVESATHRAAMSNLAKTVELFGDKVGREIFVTSITVDPYQDTLDRLAEYVRQLGAPKGWRLMRMLPLHSAPITQRMHHHDRGDAISQSVFYGNGAAHLWGSYPSMIQAADAASRIAWALPNSREAALRRGGFSDLEKSPTSYSNRIKRC